MKRILIAVLLISVIGCAKAPPPTTRVNHWVQTLRSNDAKLRKQAAFKLGNLGLTDPALVVPALAAALKDADAAVRCEAILALLKCGPAAQETSGELAMLQRKDRNAKVRVYAAKALEKLTEGK